MFQQQSLYKQKCLQPVQCHNKDPNKAMMFVIYIEDQQNMGYSAEIVNCTSCSQPNNVFCGKLKTKYGRVMPHVLLCRRLWMLKFWRCVFGFFWSFGRSYGLHLVIDVFPFFLQLECLTKRYSVILQIRLCSSETSEQITCTCTMWNTTLRWRNMSVEHW